MLSADFRVAASFSFWAPAFIPAIAWFRVAIASLRFASTAAREVSAWA